MKQNPKLISKSIQKSIKTAQNTNSEHSIIKHTSPVDSGSWSNAELYIKENNTSYTTSSRSLNIDQINPSQNLFEYNGCLSNSESSCDSSNIFLNNSKQFQSIPNDDLTFTGRFSSSTQPPFNSNEQLSSVSKKKINVIDTVIIDSSNSSESSMLWDKSSLDDTNSFVSKTNNHPKLLPYSDNSCDVKEDPSFFSIGTEFVNRVYPHTEDNKFANAISVDRVKRQEFVRVDQLPVPDERLSSSVFENISYLDAKQKNALVRSTSSKKVKTTQEILAVIQNKKFCNPFENENASSATEFSSKYFKITFFKYN